MNFKRCIFWHRKDLRFENNIGLMEANNFSQELIGVYFFDPEIFEKSIMATSRAWFILESLKELKNSWIGSGRNFLIINGDPKDKLPKLVELIKSDLVVWNKSVEPQYIAKDKKITEILNRKNVKTKTYWDHLMMQPGSIKSNTNTDYRVFTPFSKSWKKNYNKEISEVIYKDTSRLKKVIPNTEDNIQNITNISKDISVIDKIPTVEFFGFTFYNGSKCPCMPGESNAKRQLNQFLLKFKDKSINSGNNIYNYKNNRDFPFIKGTSLLSAALALGTISIRDLFKSMSQCRNNLNSHQDQNELNSINTWEQELIWREFYNHALFAFPELAVGPYREKWKKFPWENESNKFKLWEKGLTGFPIIDAAMRQLNTSGWMHNRCRMIVASFLVKDLICDWKLGEKTFMRNLVDGDLAANNGGWQWSASSGMDPKPLRIFNPHTQTSKFDPLANYIKEWIPELKHINPKDLITGEILPIERKGYPLPIVNHQKQQAYFKILYSQIS